MVCRFRRRCAFGCALRPSVSVGRRVLAGGLFILPGIVSIMLLSMIYVAFGHVGIVAGLFFGLKAAVLAIVLRAVQRLGKRALENGPKRAVAAVAFLAIFFFAVPFPLIVFTAAAFGLLGAGMGSAAFAVGVGAAASQDEHESLLGDSRPPHTLPNRSRLLRTVAIWLALWWAPVAVLWLLAGPDNIFTAIALFFSKVAVVTFGGAYAVLAYVAQEVVATQHWLRPSEMLDGLGMAETTPGPLIMVLQFVGFVAAYRAPGMLVAMLSGVLGGLLATWVTFVPCFLWIFAGGPFIEHVRGSRYLGAALAAVTAAVVGVILNLAVWFAIHALFHEATHWSGYGLSFDVPVPASVDLWALGLTVAAMIAVFWLELGMISTLAACSLAGVILHATGVLG